MTVRLRIALTIALTGLVAVLGVVLTFALALQRFEQENTYVRADAFVGRVVAMYDDLLDLHERRPESIAALLRNVLLFEPESQLYLLAGDGTVLASSGSARPGLKVRVEPVRQAVAAAGDRRRAAYVMGDDPEHMQADAVIAARALKRQRIAPGDGVEGYLYLVCQPPALRSGRAELFRSSFAGPALAGAAAVIVLTTALALWIIAAVTRPLRDLSADVAAAQRDGFEAAPAFGDAAATRAGDEFGRLRQGFAALLATLHEQWQSLRRLDQFRRESVSNLSHDLRSPLTASVACLETLQQRWAGDAARSDDQALVGVALRNTRNAAQLVRSLGDLALLDEPTYRLQPLMLDLHELLDDIVMRFADRARRQGVQLRQEASGSDGCFARVDPELFERAIANLVDNALRFTPAAGRIVLRATAHDGSIQVQVCDDGAGIDAVRLPHLFDRMVARQRSASPADGGSGLGLVIVKRIVELHDGQIRVESAPGRGTTVSVTVPAAAGTSTPDPA
ncbi:MAG: HAMP domain-containing histidine kinase [Burkholderiaceae bacterium]|nr:HAMP domain-containing histidine kinase [Burkholderiaceae bacterium]